MANFEGRALDPIEIPSQEDLRVLFDDAMAAHAALTLYVDDLVQRKILSTRSLQKVKANGKFYSGFGFRINDEDPLVSDEFRIGSQDDGEGFIILGITYTAQTNNEYLYSRNSEAEIDLSVRPRLVDAFTISKDDNGTFTLEREVALQNMSDDQPIELIASGESSLAISDDQQKLFNAARTSYETYYIDMADTMLRIIQATLADATD